MKRFALILSTAAFALALAGCAALTPAQTQPDEASLNRAYMAELNRHAAELQSAFEDFQAAVADDNTVSMQATLAQVDRIVAAAQAAKATDRLANVKASYDEALDSLDAALHAYANEYADALDDEHGKDTMTLSGVQKAYDEGIAKLQEADDAVKKISEE